MNSEKTAIIFPGQGSQYLGMGREFVENDANLLSIFEQAEQISGYPINKLCLDGPMEELTEAACLQPALTAANLVCWKALQKAGVQADYFAGHSLGEYSALCASGVLSVEDTLKLVSARGKIMGEAGRKNPGGMTAILGLFFSDIEDILNSLSLPNEVSIGNYNSSQQIVLSGTQEALAKASDLAIDKGGKAIALNVSIANHSPLMKEALGLFENEFNHVEMSVPEVPVFFNVTGKVETDLSEIRVIMVKQIISMVRWYDIINGLLDQGVKTFIEVGPKKVLTGLMKRLLPKGEGHTCFQIDTPELLQKYMDSTN